MNQAYLCRIYDSGRVALDQNIIRDFVEVFGGAGLTVTVPIQKVGQFFNRIDAAKFTVLGRPEKGTTIAAMRKFPAKTVAKRGFGLGGFTDGFILIIRAGGYGVCAT